MRKHPMLFMLLLAGILLSSYLVVAKLSRTPDVGGFVAQASDGVTQGSLQVIDPEKGSVLSECPLKHTDVKAEISGFLARVVVTQEFHNPFKDKIEAVYTFPLPQNAAVDNMTMQVGDRTVKGEIRRREEARAVYEAARQAGNVASLLDQQRPNIFTQSVANIMPGEQVKITISYVDWLKYTDGSYEFVFPMVVGPRYIPGQPIGKQAGGWAHDTTKVPDASAITPPVAPAGSRAGHDISLEVALDAGVPIDELKSTLHDVEIERPTSHSALVRLRNKSEIPNKDFILKYDVTGKQIEDAVLTHSSDGNGFFTLLLQPPERVAVEDVTPKELVFVLDTSGSMMGFPIEKAKECMKLALDGLYTQDTFNLITFSGDTHVLFPEPVTATRDNLAKAQQFLASRSGNGGTEMMKAIKAALDPSDSQDHIRIVCFMTDGYVGNDLEIIGEIQKHPNARVFSFGIGNSVNRFLLDRMAKQGRGEVEYVSTTDDGSAAARRFYERIRSPLLTDISVDWGGLDVADIYPSRIPDLFSAKPVVVTGRYKSAGSGVVKLKGKVAGHDFMKEVPVEFSDQEPRHDVLATLWARAKIAELMSQDYEGVQRGLPRPDIVEAITQLGLEYRLMTQFTSFVAVEEMTVTDGGQPRKIEVPVDMPDGVSRQGVFGEPALSGIGLSSVGGVGGGSAARWAPNAHAKMAPSAGPPPPFPARQTGAGVGAGAGRGSSTEGQKPSVVSSTVVQPVPSASRPSSVIAADREETLAAPESKLHRSIAALIERLKNKTSTPAADEARFVRNGKAEIQIFLSDKSAETLNRLKKLGFEIILEPKSARILIGRMPIDRLSSLTEIQAVRYVAPVK
jgi:Ca-activated chloride channel family protein